MRRVSANREKVQEKNSTNLLHLVGDRAKYPPRLTGGWADDSLFGSVPAAVVAGCKDMTLRSALTEEIFPTIWTPCVPQGPSTSGKDECQYDAKMATKDQTDQL